MKRSLILLAACTPPPAVQTLTDTNVSFTPAKVDLQRFPATCGLVDPSYTTDDLLQLTISGPPDEIGEASTISLAFHPTLPTGQSLTVDLGDFMQVGQFFGQNGTLPLANNSFTWQQGPNPNELDAQALSSVNVRFDAYPGADGEAVVVTIRMAFVDGAVYDVKIDTPSSTPFFGCPVG